MSGASSVEQEPVWFSAEDIAALKSVLFTACNDPTAPNFVPNMMSLRHSLLPELFNDVVRLAKVAGAWFKAAPEVPANDDDDKLYGLHEFQRRASEFGQRATREIRQVQDIFRLVAERGQSGGDVADLKGKAQRCVGLLEDVFKNLISILDKLRDIEPRGEIPADTYKALASIQWRQIQQETEQARDSVK
ncbi:hypothetical protein BKA67DRAFT_655595 [Truncatella angustata]|uniref:Uncharacterized protein n=1 Tax=Truncatella angustata TaxID=152316 RepID=A0A9P9A1U7_9PEZI|nr:uncharacterized protein BKA67DRAFT_655595 [Truncatella angustata]KAH6657320.1 hypothetical protein BKA67DRAFT_655595 [Truncatella angustata]KAH8202770.1 hypothetical protein TruAng_003041 [Truncatella angustata]